MGDQQMNFDQAFERLIGHEGGFQNDPRDKGNWTGGKVGVGQLKGTKFGISAMTYPGEDIENLTLERAKLIYARDFWSKAGIDLSPDGMRFDIFDTAVNSGAKRAVQFIQRALGVADDGVIGSVTALALSQIDPYRLLARFNGHRLDFLNDNPELWATYGRGWAQRIAENLIGA
jgi:lysozyme family protein